MAKETHTNEREGQASRLSEKVGAREDRKIRARQEKDRGVCFGFIQNSIAHWGLDITHSRCWMPPVVRRL